MDEDKLKQIISNRLNAFMKPVVPDDFTILRSKWSSNPNFQGAYSYASV